MFLGLYVLAGQMQPACALHMLLHVCAIPRSAGRLMYNKGEVLTLFLHLHLSNPQVWHMCNTNHSNKSSHAGQSLADQILQRGCHGRVRRCYSHLQTAVVRAQTCTSGL